MTTVTTCPTPRKPINRIPDIRHLTTSNPPTSGRSRYTTCDMQQNLFLSSWPRYMTRCGRIRAITPQYGETGAQKSRKPWFWSASRCGRQPACWLQIFLDLDCEAVRQDGDVQMSVYVTRGGGLGGSTANNKAQREQNVISRVMCAAI